jgi:hypothetical protein
MGRVLKWAACSFCIILLLADSSLAKEWRGIVPLNSTRTDIARLYKQITGASLSGIGLPTDSFDIVGEGRVHILYSMGRCWQGWDVARDTVVSVTVNLTEPIPFGNMRNELERLPNDEDDTGTLYYKNKKDGVYYAVQDGKIVSITYGPNEWAQQMTCKKVGRR